MNDLKFAFRQLLKNPGFTAVAVLTLALGIGASSAIFSTLDGVLFRALPYPESERLVQLYETLPGGSLNSAAGGVFLDWREHHSDFENVALINPVTRNLRGDGSPERLNGLEASHEFLSVLGIKPILGRGFLPTDDQPGANNQVVILSEDAWRSRFGGSESIVGSTLRLDEVPHTIIGVLPQGALPRAVWSPDAAQFVVPSVASRTPRGKFSRSEHWASVYGRLKPGVSVQQADAGLKALKLQLNPEYPGYKRDWGAAVRSLRERLSGGPRPVLLILVGAVAVLLLIACANVANLLLARARNRQQEIAVRAALGASPSRIVRQVLTESLVLAGGGGLAGMILSVWGIHLLGRLTNDFLPGGMTPQLDLRVLGFSLLLTGLTGLLFGILPAWQARRPDLNEALKSGGKNSTSGGHHRTQSILVVSEVALTVVLLTAAGLLLRSLANTVNADPGFQPQHALAFDLSLPKTTYPNDAARFAFSQAALERIRSVPGVENVGTGMGIPFSGGEFGERVGRSDQPRSNSDPIARINYVSADYLDALGARLMAGRDLSEADDRAKTERVIVVNEAVVRMFFPGELPVDRKLSMLGQDWRIVGVVADVPVHRLDVPTDLCLFVPHIYNTARFSIVVRTSLKPLSLVESIRREIRRLDPGLPLANVRALDSAMSGSMSQRRIILGLIAAFAGTALLLACIGLYGVMSYSVAIRRRELSIRLALGANRLNISGLVLRDALLLTALGSIVGLAGAFGAGQLLASQLYRVSRHDPLVIVGTVGVVAVVALLACWLPARRAASVDPMEALRYE